MLGKEIFIEKYRSHLEDEARWLEFGAAFKAGSIETLLKRHGIVPAGTLLELGSGTGAVIRECQRRNLAEKYIALDVSEDAIAWARPRSPGITCLVSDITSPDFRPSQNVDVVVLSHVLEHLENPRSLLSSLIERMPFEWLIAEVPLEDLLAAQVKNIFRDRSKNSAGHVQFFSGRSFRQLLTSAGLKIVDSLRYATIFDEEMLEWRLQRMSLSPGKRFIKRLTYRELPRLFKPIWGHLYHAHMAVLCKPIKGIDGVRHP